MLTDATERMRWENARSKAERAARQAQAAYANASDQARAAGFGRFDPYDRKRGAGSSYYDDFEEEAFSYDESTRARRCTTTGTSAGDHTRGVSVFTARATFENQLAEL